MAKRNDRINTDALFQNMVPQHTEQDRTVSGETSTPENEKKSEKIHSARGRKPQKEKNVQVSIYLRPDQARELRLQDALKEKESDMSAIARTGLDIVLKMSSAVYGEMKARADADGLTPGELVEQALKAYLK